MTVSREILEAARRHRAAADRVLDRGAVAGPRRAYEEEHGATIRALAGVVTGSPRRVTTGAEHRRVEVVLRQRTASLLDRMGAAFRESARETITESARSTARFIAAAEGDRNTVLHDDDMIERIVRSRGYSVERARGAALRSLNEQMHAAIHDRMRTLGTEELTRSELVSASANVLENNWWRVERTLRTETSFAFNQAQVASIRALEDEYPDVMQRWTEMVNDLSGEPMDNRVGQDSLVLHGQVARVGNSFVMPSDPRAPASMIGSEWLHPPNRPNDRAVLMPWRRGWGIPAWRMNSAGSRISLR